jgi:hypothetical protein
LHHDYIGVKMVDSSSSPVGGQGPSPSNNNASSASAYTSVSASASASCNRCVKVLREIISGLNSFNVDSKNNTGKRFVSSRAHQPQEHEESPPLTLIKAIARHQQEHADSDTTTTSDHATRHRNSSRVPPQSSSSGRFDANLSSAFSSSPDNKNDNQRNDDFEIENTEDGIRISLPVTATMPNLLRRWTRLSHVDANPTTTTTTPTNTTIATDSDNTTTTTSSTHNTAESSVTTPHGLQALAMSPAAPPPAALSPPAWDTADESQQRLTIEVKCRTCSNSGPEGGARAFLMGPTPLSIVLCHNRIHGTRHEMEEILTHELVHLYDVQTLQLDLQQCENLAYSEVRAAKAAECRDTWSQYMKSYCVKQKAICATNNLFPMEGRKCIQTVFQKAFDDNRPFPPSSS